MKGLAWIAVFTAIGAAAGAIAFALTPGQYRAVTAFEMKSVEGGPWSAERDSPMHRALSEERMERLIQDLDLHKRGGAAGRTADALLDLRASTSLSRDVSSSNADRWVVSFEATDPSTAERVSFRMASLIKAEADRSRAHREEESRSPSRIYDLPLPGVFEVTILETKVLDERSRPPLPPFGVDGAAVGLIAGVMTLPLFVWWRRRRPAPSTTIAIHRWSRRRVCLAWTLAGVLGGLGVYLWSPRTFRASATVQVVPPEVAPPNYVPPADVSERLKVFSQHVLPDARLEFIVREFDLYKQDRRGMLILGDVVDRMRHDIAIELLPGADAASTINFTVSFEHSDPMTAMRVATRLASAFVDDESTYSPDFRRRVERRTVIEASRVPEEPVSPRLLLHLAFGTFSGLTAGVVFSVIAFLRDRGRAGTQA